MKNGLLAFLLLVTISGCSSSKPKPAPTPATETKLPVTSVNTTNPEIVVNEIDDPDSKKPKDPKADKNSFVIRGTKSEVNVEKSGVKYGTLYKVTGEILKNGQVQSRVAADEARLDNKNQTLQLTGHVTVTGDRVRSTVDVSEKQAFKSGVLEIDTVPVVMSAEKLTYDLRVKDYVANGSVTVTSGSMVLGPLPKITATKELFENRDNRQDSMIRTHIPFLVIASLALGAQKQDKPQMTDKAKNFALWFTESSIERIDKDTNSIDVSGNPMHGYSKEQNLEFSARSMKGVIQSVSGGSMLIQNATVSGNAIFNITSEKGKTTLKMAKATLTDDGQKAVITIPTSFECTNFSTSSSGATQSGSRSLNLTASQGTFNLKTLAKRDDDPLISADLSGPVKVVVVANDEKGKTTLYTLTGNSAKIRAEGTDKIVSMVGDVHVTSDSDNAIGSMEVPNVTLVLNKELEVKSVRTKGSGTGTVKEKKDGQ